MLTKLGIVLLTFFASVSGEEEVAQIDRQIEQLEELQGQVRSNVQRNVGNAMRWQFQNENYLDARRAWDRAAADKEKIKELQDQIDDLKARKKKILQGQ